MQKIINPILNDGKSKVTVIRNYERRLSHGRIDKFIAIFIHENKIYLYVVEYDYKYHAKYKDLTDFGEIEPLNMEKAVNSLKNNI